MFAKYPRLATPTRNGLWGKTTAPTYQTVGGNKIFQGGIRVTGELVIGSSPSSPGFIFDGSNLAIGSLDDDVNDGGRYIPFYSEGGEWRIYPTISASLPALSPAVDLFNRRVGFGTTSPQAPHHFVHASSASTSVVFERHNGRSWMALNNGNSGTNITTTTDLGGVIFSGFFNGINSPSLWVSGLFGQYAGNGLTRSGTLYFAVQNSGAVNNPAYMHNDGRVVLGRALIATPPQASVTAKGHSSFTNAFLIQNSSDLNAFGIVNSIRQAFFEANVRFNVRSVVGTVALLDTDFAVQVNASGGASTAELADISSLTPGSVQVVIKNDASANNVTVNPRSGQTILTGSATLTTSARVAGFMAITSTTWIRIF